MDTRDRILEVGRGILLDSGLRALTTNEVARRARISKKTLYRLFPTKRNLMEAVMISLVGDRLSTWDRILDDTSPIISRLHAAFVFVERFFPQLQANVLTSVAEIDPVLWKKIDRIRRERLGRLKDLLSEAQEAGYVTADIDADLWFLLLFTTIQHAITPKTLIEDGISLSEITLTTRKIYFDGLLTSAGRQALADISKEEQ